MYSAEIVIIHTHILNGHARNSAVKCLIGKSSSSDIKVTEQFLLTVKSILIESS